MGGAGMRHVFLPWMGNRGQRGFTLLELLLVVAIVSVMSAIAVPAFSSFRDDVRLKAVAWEIAGMVKEAKLRGVGEQYYALCFDPGRQTVALVSGRGEDEEWNTGDEPVVRSFRLSDRGGLEFWKKPTRAADPRYAKPDDGIAAGVTNSFICNDGLTGNGGTVYIKSPSGAAVAITVNSRDFGCTTRKWKGEEWKMM